MNIVEKVKKSINEDNFYWFGLFGSIFVLIAMFVPQIGYTGRFGEPYSMLNHFVSELGEMGVSDLALVFNLGLIIGGILYIPFLIGLALHIDNIISKIAGVIGVISSIFASLVGVFPMNNLIPHYIVAMTYFMGGVLTVFVFTVATLIQKEPNIPKWTSLLGIIVIIINVISITSMSPGDLEFEGGFEELIEGGFMNIFENRPDILSLAILEWAMILSVVFYLLLAAVYIAIISRNK